MVTTTANPLVAAYTVKLATKADVKVLFSKDSTYGLSTSSQTAQPGVPLTILVAGMQQKTTYHLRAVIAYADGTTSNDDQSFTTGDIPSNLLPQLTATTTSGLTPQPGIEMINPVIGSPTTAFATDLEGNIIWYYAFPDRVATSQLYPIRILPNGHLGVFLNSTGATTGAPAGQAASTPAPTIALREIDLAGNTIQQLLLADLNKRLATAGFNLTVFDFSHDFLILPNGHWLIIAGTTRNFTNLAGYPGNLEVTGDSVIDLDENLQPVWTWNDFDHLDINRHPYMFPDWTHANSLSYSTDDGNFIISLRHQNWVLKVDYRDGAGTGNVLWTLGEGGDFKLVNGTDPTDWFYAQHYVTYLTPNTTGIFNLGVMDNGDDRMFPAGVTCGTANEPTCLYSTVQVLQINEQAKTASFQFHQILPSDKYSFFGGNTDLLANGNIEYDLAGVGTESYMNEVTPTATPQTVWQLHTMTSNAYRGIRIPSLYPGIQW